MLKSNIRLHMQQIAKLSNSDIQLKLNIITHAY